LRKIETALIQSTVKELCLEANYCLREDVYEGLKKSLKIEKSECGREILKQLIENARIAREQSIPICQDTGFVTVFVQIGQEIAITDGNLNRAIESGVREAYKKGYLRPSVVAQPCFSRENTQDNTPPLVYASIIPGDELKIIVMPKGGGSENASRLKMMGLSEGLEGVKDFVLEVIGETGANSCPPVVVGLGIGGTFDSVGFLAKKALLREIDKKNPDAQLALLEEELLQKINDLGIGPAGLGGRVTAMSVNIESFPSHMACLPVAVNISCHALRSAERVL